MPLRKRHPARASSTAPGAILRLALLQHACGEDPEKNLRHTIAMIREAAGRGAHLIVTQELFRSRYFPQTESPASFRLAEPIPGPISTKLCALAKKLRVEISASLFEKRAPGLFHNTSILIDARGKIVGKYRKMHIPDDPRFYEKYYFTPGDLGWQVVPTRRAAIGLQVCWDQWYPEAARLNALRGAQIILYPTAIAWHREDGLAIRGQQIAAWRTIQRAHAIAKGLFVAAVNRIGVEGDLTFWGGSFVADPGGEIIAQAGQTGDEVLMADCDLTRIDHIRQGWPFLRDRRIDAYGDLTQRYVDPQSGRRSAPRSRPRPPRTRSRRGRPGI
jgi:N-carbamoylputrescine amidase